MLTFLALKLGNQADFFPLGYVIVFFACPRRRQVRVAFVRHDWRSGRREDCASKDPAALSLVIRLQQAVGEAKLEA